MRLRTMNAPIQALYRRKKFGSVVVIIRLSSVHDAAYRPKLSDPAHECVRLQPRADGRVLCSAWLNQLGATNFTSPKLGSQNVAATDFSWITMGLRRLALTARPV